MAARTTSHECAGCGGSGQDTTGVRYYIPPFPRCPVCLGAGQISDRMPARDAMADAETLRLEAIRKDYGYESGKCQECFSYHDFGWMWSAKTLPFVGAADAIVAARAAFRAVPALRGDR